MPQYEYSAYSEDGDRVSGTISAASADRARSDLKAQRLTVYEIAEEGPAPTTSSTGLFAGKAGAQDVLATLRQIATLIQAKVPLLQVWETVSTDAPHPQLRQSAADVASQLRAGARLGDAWREVGPEIPEFALRLVEVGDKSGALPETIKDAVDQLEFQQKVISDIRGALAYPAFLVVAGFAVVLFILGFVVPRFADMAATTGTNLPAVSQIVLSTGVFVSENFLLVLIGIGAAIGGLVFAASSEGGRGALIGTVQTLPMIRKLIFSMDLARWGGIVSMALRHGVHLTEALTLARSVVVDQRFGRRLEDVERDLRSGSRLADSATRHLNLPAGDLSIIRAGESTGGIPDALAMIAGNHKEQTQRLVKVATTFFEPMAIMVVAMFVGTIVVSLVLAMTSFYDFAG